MLVESMEFAKVAMWDASLESSKVELMVELLVENLVAWKVE